MLREQITEHGFTNKKSKEIFIIKQIQREADIIILIVLVGSSLTQNIEPADKETKNW